MILYRPVDTTELDLIADSNYEKISAETAGTTYFLSGTQL